MTSPIFWDFWLFPPSSLSPILLNKWVTSFMNDPQMPYFHKWRTLLLCVSESYLLLLCAMCNIYFSVAPTKTFYYLVLPPFIHKDFFFCCTYPQGLSVNTIQLGWSSVRSTNWTQVKFSQCLMAYKKIMYYVYHYKLKVRYFQKKCQVISF